MGKINSQYLKGLLQEKKDLIRDQMREMILDKGSSLAMIRERESEMVLIDEQIKELEKLDYETEGHYQGIGKQVRFRGSGGIGGE
jgi:hypothetical protein